MSRHRAGRLNQRLQLQRWSGDKTARGAPMYGDAHWIEEETLWAKIEPLSGSEVERARQLVPEATYHIEVRRYTTSTMVPTAGKRFVHADGRRFYVAHVANEMEADAKLICLCGTQPPS